MSTPLISVRMCDSPQCAGFGACDRIPPGPLAAVSHWIDRSGWDDPKILRFFAQEVALSPCSDDKGVWHIVPEGAEFTVHVGEGSLPLGQAAAGNPGREFCTAVYSGPARTRSELVGGSPAWDETSVEERVARWQTALAAA